MDLPTTLGTAAICTVVNAQLALRVEWHRMRSAIEFPENATAAIHARQHSTLLMAMTATGLVLLGLLEYHMGPLGPARWLAPLWVLGVLTAGLRMQKTLVPPLTWLTGQMLLWAWMICAAAATLWQFIALR